MVKINLYDVTAKKKSYHKTRVLFWIAALFFFVLCGKEAFAVDKTSIEVALQSFYFDYQENAGSSPNGTILSGNDRGQINGLRFSYLRLNPDADRDFRVNAFVSKGSTNYSGVNQGNAVSGVNSNVMVAIEALTMYDYIEVIQTQLYCGLGYRAWWRGVCADSGGSMKELYSWLYVPLGLRYKHEFSSNLECEPDLSARLMLAGTVIASNIPVDSQTYDVSMQLGNKYGINFKVPFMWKVDKELALIATPWADYSEIGASNWYNLGNSTNQVMEPASQTWQYGAELGIRYTF